MYGIIWGWMVLLGASLCMPTPAQAHPRTAQDTVRIRVLELERPAEVKIWAQHGPLYIFTHRQVRLIGGVQAGERVTLESWAPEVQLRWRRGGAQVAKAEFHVPPGALLHLEVEGLKGREVRAYRGWLSVQVDPDNKRGLLRLINHVHLEDYVASVIPSEYNFKDLEGVKAQAVAIRTYAVRSVRDHRATAYHMSDHEASQKYEGALRETNISRKAARQTQGQVLTYRNRLIEAVYSSSCGGHTANNEDVWNSTPIPYLRGRPDPYETLSPHRNWSSTVPRNWLMAHLSRRYNIAVTGLQLGRRGKDGRLKSVLLKTQAGPTKSISAAAFRMLVNRKFGPTLIRSANFSFSLNSKRDEYRFEGHGYGHGVGLCQWGTAAQAKAGRPYQQILAFYYKDTALQKMSIQPDRVMVAVATSTVEEVWPEDPPAPAPPPAETPPARRDAEDLNDAEIRPPLAPPVAPPPAETLPAETPPPVEAPPKKIKKRRIGW